MGPGGQSLKDCSLEKNSNNEKGTFFFSRIHVEDIANAVCRSMKKVTPGEIFNVCDDLPSQSDVVVKYAAKLMDVKKLETIDFNDPKINEKTKSFYLDNKKVKNDKIKKILNWTPKFRTYKLGLDNIFYSLSNENSSTNTSITQKN